MYFDSVFEFYNLVFGNWDSTKIVHTVHVEYTNIVQNKQTQIMAYIFLKKLEFCKKI